MDRGIPSAKCNDRCASAALGQCCFTRASVFISDRENPLIISLHLDLTDVNDNMITPLSIKPALPFLAQPGLRAIARRSEDVADSARVIAACSLARYFPEFGVPLRDFCTC